MEASYFGGFLAIFILFIIIAVIFANWKNGRIGRNNDYDERQKLVRGESYKYGFLTLAAASMAALYVQNTVEAAWAKPAVLQFAALALSLLVFAGYAIFHDGFLSLSEKPILKIVAMLFIGVFNVMIFIGDHARNAADNYEIDSSYINLLCAATMFVVAIMLTVKLVINKRAEKKEDDI